MGLLWSITQSLMAHSKTIVTHVFGVPRAEKKENGMKEVREKSLG